MKHFIILSSICFIFCIISCKNANSNFETSHENVDTTKLNKEKIEDLFVLGKVWGYLKYYHPVVASGKYKWDNELFKILPKVKAADGSNDRNKILLSWIHTLGKFETIHDEKIDTSLVKLYPDLAWIQDSITLGKDLSEELIKISHAKRSDYNHYVSIPKFGSNPKFTNEDSITVINYPNQAYQLLALYRYWNIIQYYYPYKHLIGNWNDVLSNYIPKFFKVKNELEYKLTILELITNIHDSHGGISNFDKILAEYKGFNIAPLQLSFIENKLVITGILNNKPTPDNYFVKESFALPILKEGDVILSINNKSIDKMIRERGLITTASNKSSLLRNIAMEIMRTNNPSLTIQYKRDDSIKLADVQCYPIVNMNMMQYFQHDDTCFKFIDKTVAYIYPGNIKKGFVEAIMPLILNTKGIIIDLRCYPSDNSLMDLAYYLLPQKKIFSKGTKGDIKSPGLFTFMNTPPTVGEKNPDYYKGQVIILVNEITQSQAEYSAMFLQTAPNAKVIGSNTAGADGNVSMIHLPGNLKTGISGMGIYYPDGKETQRTGIVPDIFLAPTIKGINEGRDEVLDKAIELINSK